jgi:hypothetical protein
MSPNDFFYYANYSYWDNIPFVSVCEFAHLAFGFDPIERIHNATVQNFPYEEYEHLEEFKGFYRRIVRLAEELPTQSTKLVKIRYSQAGETKYEAVFLCQWAKSNNFLVKSNYQPKPSVDEEDLHLNSEIPNNLANYLDKKRLIDNGWFNLESCTAPKLKALIYAYAKEMALCINNESRKFSTGSVAEHLAKDYEVINSEEKDHAHFFKSLGTVASVSPTGRSLKKKVILEKA